MKNLYTISITMLAALLLAVSCGRDQMNFDEPPVPQDGMGYLLLAGMELGVSTDAETLDIPSRPSAPASTALTSRAPEPAADSYILTITNADDEVAWTGTYGEIKAMTEALPLQPGFYTMQAKSSAQMSSVAWEKPEYNGSTEFKIVKKQTTEVKDLVCTLINIKATVEVAADLKALFKEDAENPLKVAVAIQGGGTCDFLRDQTQAAFFEPIGKSNTMTVTISGMYNIKGEGEAPEYQFVSMDSQPIENVKGGQWRKIGIAIEHTEDGNAQFIVTVETWVYDEQIDVDTMSPFYDIVEEEVRDNDEGVSDAGAPEVSLDGNHPIGEPYRINANSFDPDLNTCIDRIQLFASPEGTAAIAKAYCTFSSDNQELLAALAAAGCKKNMLPLYPTNGASDYLIVRTDEMNRLVVKVNDAGMYGIYDYPGTHTVQVIVDDSQKRRSYTTLTLMVTRDVSVTPPSITGLHGFDFATRHSLHWGQGMQVTVDVSSQTGITGFKIEILGGEILTDTELEGLSLASKMDLINPASEAMKKQLQILGFLPKDGSSIKGKKNLIFDISEFMPAMSGLGRTGDCDFRLIVSDAAGTTEKILMFNITK